MFSQTQLVVLITCYIPWLVLSVSLNGKPVKSLPNYHYEAYLDLPDADGALTANKEKKGYILRLIYLSNCQTIELCGRLHAGLFNSNRMLINVLDMNIKVTRAPEAFYPLAPLDDTKIRIKILVATVFVTRNKLTPSSSSR